MIERVQSDTAIQQGTQPQAQPARTAEPSKSFASALAQETARARRTNGTGGSDAPRSAADAPRTADANRGPSAEVRDRIAKAPEGETYKPVRGQRNYAEITSGPREGQFINISRNERRGLTFTIEQKDGKSYHVYGTGDDAKWIEVKSAGRRPAESARPPKGETWEHVAGTNNYADILTGKRNGWYVNISGGDRHGQVFHIVKRGDKTFHVYGKGDDKLWVEVRTRTEQRAEGPARSEETSSSGGTGGASAPSGDED
jgi:hypothetical protein